MAPSIRPFLPVVTPLKSLIRPELSFPKGGCIRGGPLYSLDAKGEYNIMGEGFHLAPDTTTNCNHATFFSKWHVLP